MKDRQCYESGLSHGSTDDYRDFLRNPFTWLQFHEHTIIPMKARSALLHNLHKVASQNIVEIKI